MRDTPKWVKETHKRLDDFRTPYDKHTLLVKVKVGNTTYVSYVFIVPPVFPSSKDQWYISVTVGGYYAGSKYFNGTLAQAKDAAIEMLAQVIQERNKAFSQMLGQLREANRSGA